MSETSPGHPEPTKPPVTGSPEEGGPKSRWGPPASLSGWVQLLANLVVIIGASVAVWQIRELRADRRRDNAMQYVMLLHAERYAETALNISTAMQEQAPPTDPRLALPNIQRLGDLYVSAILCRERQVCDGPTIDANFRDDILGFYRLTYDREMVALACRLGDGAGSYGAPLRAYLDATRGAGEGPVPATTRTCA